MTELFDLCSCQCQWSKCTSQPTDGTSPLFLKTFLLSYLENVWRMFFTFLQLFLKHIRERQHSLNHLKQKYRRTQFTDIEGDMNGDGLVKQLKLPWTKILTSCGVIVIEIAQHISSKILSSEKHRAILTVFFVRT